MSDIRRWRDEPCTCVPECAAGVFGDADGPFVLFSDHVAALERRDSDWLLALSEAASSRSTADFLSLILSVTAGYTSPTDFLSGGSQ